MLRRHKINIMHAPYILQLDIPLRQVLGRQMKAILLMRDIVVLAKDTPQVTAGEEDAAAPVVALEARLFAKMRRDGVDDDIGADQAGSALFEAVYAAEARAEIAVAEMSVGLRSLLCFLLG